MQTRTRTLADVICKWSLTQCEVRGRILRHGHLHVRTLARVVGDLAPLGRVVASFLQQHLKARVVPVELDKLQGVGLDVDACKY